MRRDQLKQKAQRTLAGLAAASMLAAPAIATEGAPAEEPTTTVTVEANSTPNGMTKAIHTPMGQNLKLEHGPYTLYAETNPSSVNDGESFVSIDRVCNAGEWTLVPGLWAQSAPDTKAGSDDESDYAAYLIANRETALGTLKTLTLLGKDRFAFAKVQLSGDYISVGAKAKRGDWSEHETDLSAYLAAHDKEGRYGLAAGLTDDGEPSVTGTLDLPGLGAFLFTRNDDGPESMGYAIVSGNDDSRRMGGLFGTGNLTFTEGILSLGLVRPYFGNLPATSSQGDWAVEAAWSSDGERDLYQLLAGAPVGEVLGVEVGLGAGGLLERRLNSNDDWRLAGELSLRKEFDDSAVSFTLRESDGLTGTLNYTKRF